MKCLVLEEVQSKHPINTLMIKIDIDLLVFQQFFLLFHAINSQQ